MTSSLIWFLSNLYTNLPRAYQSGIPNFSLIRQKRAEIYSREVNRELCRKIEYCVTVTLSFKQMSQISIGSEPVWHATVKRNFCQNRCSGSIGILFTGGQIDIQTHKETNRGKKNITPPWFRESVKDCWVNIRCFIP